MKKSLIFDVVYYTSFIFMFCLLTFSENFLYMIGDILYIVLLIINIIYGIVYAIVLKILKRFKITTHFLYLFITLFIFALYYYLKIMIFGYKVCHFLNCTGKIYYGLQALENIGLEHLIYFPIFIISLLYIVIYLIVKLIKRKINFKKI